MADGFPPISALAALSDPFPDTAISWRIGATNGDKSKGMALAYIDARDVMERLDTVCGPGNWQDRYVETPKGRILCSLSIRIGGEWVEKSDGAGETDVESEKGAISDALKRAAVKWGVGRYLYSIDSPWILVEQRGKSTVMKDGERKKLDRCHHDYVKSFQQPFNAGASDAGQRETPKAQQEAGADDPPPASAPAQTMSKGDARPEFSALQEGIRNCLTVRELEDWGKLNAPRAALLPQDWRADINKQYREMLKGLEALAYKNRAAAQADQDFAEERA